MAAAKRGGPSAPTRNDRANAAEDAEYQIAQAASACSMVAADIDPVNAELIAAWERLSADLQDMVARAKKLAC